MIQYLQINLSEMNDTVLLDRFLLSRSHYYNSQFAPLIPHRLTLLCIITIPFNHKNGDSVRVLK